MTLIGICGCSTEEETHEYRIFVHNAASENLKVILYDDVDSFNRENIRDSIYLDSGVKLQLCSYFQPSFVLLECELVGQITAEFDNGTGYYCNKVGSLSELCFGMGGRNPFESLDMYSRDTDFDWVITITEDDLQNAQILPF